MILHLSLMPIVMLLLLRQTIFGQTQKTKDNFPAYDQIKPQSKDIADYGNSSGTIRVEKKTINLYNYPKGTVTYILNGISLTNATYVKQLLINKDIDSVAIGRPNQLGKRIITIKYEEP